MVRPSSSDVWPRARSLTTTSMGVDPPGVAVVNSPMSAPSDRLPFFRVERRRAAIDRIVHYGDAAAVHTVFIDGRVKKKWGGEPSRRRARRARLRPARPRQ